MQMLATHVKRMCISILFSMHIYDDMIDCLSINKQSLKMHKIFADHTATVTEHLILGSVADWRGTHTTFANVSGPARCNKLTWGRRLFLPSLDPSMVPRPFQADEVASCLWLFRY